jgi:hypothetical protein
MPSNNISPALQLEIDRARELGKTKAAQEPKNLGMPNPAKKSLLN